MTNGERAVWIAVFAASWHQSTGQEAGIVLDDSRARWCARQATRALNSLHEIADSDVRVQSSDCAVEVLK